MQQNKNDTPVSALYKCFGILELLSEGRATLTDISRKVGMPKSTALRFLSSLLDLDVVRRNEHGDYALTAKLFGLGAKALEAFDLIPTALPFMRALNERTSETVHLAVEGEGRVVYLHKVDTTHTLCMHSRIGYQAPLYCTSLGKCLLAWSDPARAERLIQQMEFVKKQPNTLADAESLRRHLAEVRAQGYACDNEEIEEHVICFGAPIFDWATQVIAAISVSMPTLRFSEEKKEDLLQELKAAAGGISRALGYQGNPAR